MGAQPDPETLVGFVADGDLSPVVDAMSLLPETGDAFAAMRARDRR